MSVASPWHSRSFRTSRGVVMVGIVLLHGVVVALGLAMKGQRQEEQAEMLPIQVTMASERLPRTRPLAHVRMEEVVLPPPIVPVIQINLPVEPRTAITLAAAPPAASAPVAADSGDPVSVSQPDYLQMPRPAYPPAARRAHAQGIVYVRALVDVDGHARQVSVARSSGFELLDRAACNAVLGALFKPYRHNSVARSMVVIVPVEFSLTTRTVDAREDHHGRRHPGRFSADEQSDYQVSE